MWGLKKKYPSAKATRIIRPTYALLKGWPYKRGSTVDRFNGWQSKPDYFGCAPHKCFQLGFLLVGGATKLHSDGESQNAFDDSMIESF